MPPSADTIAAAVAAFHAGENNRTISIALEALSTSDSATLRHLLGVTYCRMGDVSTGITHLERAAALRPRDPQILLMLMRAFIDVGRPHEALAVAFVAEGLPATAVAALWRTRAEAAHDFEPEPGQTSGGERGPGRFLENPGLLFHLGFELARAPARVTDECIDLRGRGLCRGIGQLVGVRAWQHQGL